MADLPDDRFALAALCENLARLIRTAEAEGWSPELDAARQALREGARRPEEVIRDLSDLLGLDVSARGRPAIPDLPARAYLPPSPGGYRCPMDRCLRKAQSEPGGPVPTCEVYAIPLKYSPR